MAGVIAQQGDVVRALQLWNQSLELKEQIGDVKGKAATLSNMAGVIAQQGDVVRALQLWNQSLELKEQIGDVKGKAATLSNMAGVIAQQGDVVRALQLWNQSLELKEQIGDVKGKAATLHNMAGVIAQQGDVVRALQLWNQSLELKEQIGDVKGKAATLANMAHIAGKAGDKARQLTLNLQAAEALEQVRAYVDLVTVLSNLGATAETNALVYRAQALWLCLRIQVPLVDTIQLIAALFNAVPQGDELEALLSATALYFCNLRGANHPQLAQLKEDSFKLLTIAAQAQGIQTQEPFDRWFTQQQLNDSNSFLPRLNQQLETLIDDSWLFDRSAFNPNP